MPNDSLRKSLQERLELNKALMALSSREEYSHYLKPLLLKGLHNEWLNPNDFKTNDEFMIAYRNAEAYARAVKKILRLIDDAEKIVEDINIRLAPRKSVI